MDRPQPGSRFRAYYLNRAGYTHTSPFTHDRTRHADTSGGRGRTAHRTRHTSRTHETLVRSHAEQTLCVPYFGLGAHTVISAVKSIKDMSGWRRVTILPTSRTPPTQREPGHAGADGTALSCAQTRASRPILHPDPTCTISYVLTASRRTIYNLRPLSLLVIPRVYSSQPPAPAPASAQRRRWPGGRATEFSRARCRSRCSRCAPSAALPAARWAARPPL